MKQYKISIIGLGYVGLPMGIILSKKHIIKAYDTNRTKLKKVSEGDFLLSDSDLVSCPDISIADNMFDACSDAEFVIVAVPTDFNAAQGSFDTSVVESVLSEIIQINDKCVIVVKSTVPVGFSIRIRQQMKYERIIVCPEFLRETHAVYDSLHPSRIVIGTDIENDDLTILAKEFATILEDASHEESVRKYIVGFSEAESIKLFSNTYLALRVAFFNELDTYACSNNLNVSSIIEGVCADERIGNFYNNPSFGYGGYCLPKDTKQLLANYEEIPESLIEAIIESNQTRKNYIADFVIKKAETGSTIGIYRLIMKNGSDNYRNTSVDGVIERLLEKHMSVILYEPLLCETREYKGAKVVNDLTEFKKCSDYILANRYDSSLDDVRSRVFTRDIYKRD